MDNGIIIKRKRLSDYELIVEFMFKSTIIIQRNYA